MHLLFWSALRPSEAAALTWGTVDLRRGRVSVKESRYLNENNPPKVPMAERTVPLHPSTVELLREMQPLHVPPETPVFLNTRGRQINQDSFSEHWDNALRALGLRHRGLYQTKHTYVSLALLASVPIKRLEAQTGVAAQTLLRHYSAYVAQPGDRPIWEMMEASREDDEQDETASAAPRRTISGAVLDESRVRTSDPRDSELEPACSLAPRAGPGPQGGRGMIPNARESLHSAPA
ncbi:MAG: tyrosine-type recombinase/integrase [Candidatus Binatia bacterium]|nr:tyrosine-type recombinase/integrase [Candidatus Binatia bacterium]